MRTKYFLRVVVICYLAKPSISLAEIYPAPLNLLSAGLSVTGAVFSAKASKIVPGNSANSTSLRSNKKYDTPLVTVTLLNGLAAILSLHAFGAILFKGDIRLFSVMMSLLASMCGVSSGILLANQNQLSEMAFLFTSSGAVVGVLSTGFWVLKLMNYNP